jgi:deoxyribonuclease IV
VGLDAMELLFVRNVNVTENNRDKILKSKLENDVDFRLEDTGKGTQFGTLEELVSLCKEFSTCKLCIDFAHIHARGNGALKTYKDFIRILSMCPMN